MNIYLAIYGKPRFLGRVAVEEDLELAKGTPVVIESSRGTEIGVVAGPLSPQQEGIYRAIDNRQEGQPTSDSGLQNVRFIQVASVEQLVEEEQNRREEERTLVTGRQILAQHKLDMKLVDVEYLVERKKLYLYFTSEQRIDFRAYVRDLAREFRTRIELRQIGARDEAKVNGGMGACGRECCCSYWLHRFLPIGIRMVKEQNLTLNPTKISGLCGRLMCCMGYEQSTYREIWSHLPAPGHKMKTEKGTFLLLSIDVARRTCQIRGPRGFLSIPVDAFPTFKKIITEGGEWNNEEQGYNELGEPLKPEGGCCSGDGCTQCPKKQGDIFEGFKKKTSLPSQPCCSENGSALPVETPQIRSKAHEASSPNRQDDVHEGESRSLPRRRRPQNKPKDHKGGPSTLRKAEHSVNPSPEAPVGDAPRRRRRPPRRKPNQKTEGGQD